MTSLIERFNAVCERHIPENTQEGIKCCKNVVVLHHKDTLGQPLPAGIVVNVYDEVGKVHPGVIDENGESRHGEGSADPTGGNPQVRCGEISWQLLREPKASPKISEYTNNKIVRIKRRLADKDETVIHYPSDGYVLIKAKARDEEESVISRNPKYQLSRPLEIGAYWQNGGYEYHIEATYLPPPLTLNLRFRQGRDNSLNDEAMYKLIRQLNADGKVATLFIHGYNVSLGNTGCFPTFEEVNDTRSVSRNSPKVPYMFPMRSSDIQRPWLHYTDGEITALAKTELSQSLRHSNDLDNPHMKFIAQNIDARFNGKNALSWFPHLEYYLNLAASGKQTPEANLSAEDWEKYSRIIGVTWSGSVTPSNVFLRAEMYANEAGRELAKVLKDLIQSKIKINIITHSLGARVALAALNILGDYDGEYDNKVDNLIMWEAAVADNAITGNYTRDKNPLAMELFPFAYKVVKRMRILYSQEDGVLGGSIKSEDIYGLVGGAYPMKYSTLAGNSNALQDYYQQNLIAREFDKIEAVKRQCRVHTGYKDSSRCVNFAATPEGVGLRREIKRLLEEEAEAVSTDIDRPLNYLKPWSHFRRFEVGSEYFEHITDVLTNLVLNNWRISYKEMAVRPALGHQGNRLTVDGIWFNNKPLSEAQKKEWFDSFISDRTNKESENNPDNQFWFWDQSNYFISHSAMREFEFKIFDKKGFFEDIYKESYKTQIMDRWIKENSNFGRY